MHPPHAQALQPERAREVDRGDNGRRRQRRRRRRVDGIKIFQANVGRGGPATHTALQKAYEHDADIVLLQEPGLWRNPHCAEWVPKSHPAFAIFLPQTTEGTGPRAITYVREDRLARLRVTQRQYDLAADTGDVVSLRIGGLVGTTLDVVNVYNAPIGVKGQMEGLRALTGSRWEPDQRAVLVAGDFNAHHALWATEQASRRANAAGRLLSQWIGTQDWALEVEPGTPTHGVGGRSGGAALDLVFSSSKLQSLDWVTQCRTRPDLATGADHEVVWTELQARSDAHPREQGRLALHRMDEQRFAAELHAMAPLFEPLASQARASALSGQGGAGQQLDEAVEAWQRAMTAAMEASTPRASGRRGGYVWWNKDCEAAHERLLQARRQCAGGRYSQRRAGQVEEAKKELRRTTTRAKTDWGRRRIEGLEDNDIFGAMKWSAGARRYRAPALRGEDGRMMVSAEDKAAALRDALLPPPRTADLPHIDLTHILPHTLPDRAVTEQEISSALFSQSSDKAAGPDEIGFST
ncbi:hypothetical protein V8E36_001892, partial [Tilletia maclaganii]